MLLYLMATTKFTAIYKKGSLSLTKDIRFFYLISYYIFNRFIFHSRYFSKIFTKLKQIRHPGRVASVVTIRLRKPLDSIRIGLSQVLLIGSLAFSSSLSNVQNDVPTQYHSKTNSSQTLHWLLLLQHCLNKVSTKPLMQKQLIEAVRSTPHLVTCCFSLLFHKQSHLYVQRIEEFLLKLSRGSKDLSHQLFGLILNGHPDDQGGSQIHIGLDIFNFLAPLKQIFL